MLHNVHIITHADVCILVLIVETDVIQFNE